MKSKQNRHQTDSAVAPTDGQSQTDEEAQSDGQDSTLSEDRKFIITRAVPAWLVSTILHTGLIVILAILSIAQIEDKEVSLTVETSQQVEDYTEFTVLEFEEPDLEQDESMEPAAEESISELSANVELEAPNFASLSDMEAVSFEGLGEELDMAGEDMGITKFFGAEQSGQKFVFVVDNSNSMTKGKFETALNELSKTVSDFTSKQQFHVIFFSDTAYLMFHPRPVTTLVPANGKNKERLREWLYSVEMCLKTKGEDAMKAAIAMNPDVIYILGDGAFTDKTEQLLTAPHRRRIVINTLGMQVDPKGERQLRAIAKANKGTYRNVKASPGAIASAKQNPIRRNNIRGKVWGITLPLVKKQK